MAAIRAHHLGVYGTNGLTAYFGLFDLGEPKAGQTLVVSAAAGSVGHIVGQMAKIVGCRVVGVAGSDEKCRLLTDELGFDAAVNYRDANFRGAFREACGDGIDIYFDNTGGEILGGALRRMNTHGRIVCCGVVSQYDTGNPAPGPRGIPGLLVNNRVRMEGFLVFDYAGRYGEARAQMREWVESGQLKPLQDEFHGLEEAPNAFIDLLAGGNTGTRINPRRRLGVPRREGILPSLARASALALVADDARLSARREGRMPSLRRPVPPLGPYPRRGDPCGRPSSGDARGWVWPTRATTRVAPTRTGT